MTSKKTPASKRASPPRAADFAKPFLKDWERLSRSDRYDMNRLKEAMLLLIANDSPLGPEWLDHPLGGDWDGHRECHIGGDFLWGQSKSAWTMPVIYMAAIGSERSHRLFEKQRREGSHDKGAISGNHKGERS